MWQWLIVGLFLLCGVVFASQPLTRNEQRIVSSLGCQSQHYITQNGRLIFGDRHHAPKRFYLIKNITSQSIWLDFPEGHIGATAFIGQTLAPGSWTAYVRVPGTGYLPAMRGKTTVVSRLRWSCSAHGSSVSECQKDLYVCTTTRYPVAQIANPLLTDTLVILARANRSWWAGISPRYHSIPEVIGEWKRTIGYAGGQPLYGTCPGCQRPGATYR